MSRLLLLLFLLFVCTAFSKNSTPVAFKDFNEKIEMKEGVFWTAPDYTRQENALGYKTGVFSVPTKMEERVSFWIDIYTKYNTDQGLLHDSLYVHLVYEVVDFTNIMNNKELSAYQKQRARERRIKEEKKKIQSRLKKLSRLVSPAGLHGEDLRYWYLFSKIDEKNKFKKAIHRSRLRFQLGQSDRFLKGIYHSGKYLKTMERIFKERGLPLELTRLPFVESSFNYKARSHVGASGIWQFMRYTAREYMRMDISVDERNDPIKSTIAAAQKMTRNYKMLGAWPLAVTGYNHGPSGVRRMVRKFGTNDLTELIEKRKGRFRFASANFYASFLAAVEVEKRADQFFTTPIYWHPLQVGEEIKLKRTITYKELLRWFDGDLTLAKDFNPHLRPNVWKGRVNIGRKNFVRVPVEKYDVALAEIPKLKTVPLINGKTYKVSRGDTMGHIARNFGVRLGSLMRANSGINPKRLRIGQKIYIPIK